MKPLKDGDKVIIEGVIKQKGNTSSIYDSNESRPKAFDSTAADAVGQETVSQVTQSGIQAVVAQVQ